MTMCRIFIVVYLSMMPLLLFGCVTNTSGSKYSKELNISNTMVVLQQQADLELCRRLQATNEPRWYQVMVREILVQRGKLELCQSNFSLKSAQRAEIIKILKENPIRTERVSKIIRGLGKTDLCRRLQKGQVDWYAYLINNELQQRRECCGGECGATTKIASTMAKNVETKKKDRKNSASIAQQASASTKESSPTKIKDNENQKKIALLGKDDRYGEREIPVEIYFPPGVGRVPLIISQHGSMRDGIRFADGLGRTDEYSSRLIKRGTKAGFAVAVIDAFKGTGVSPNSKARFPRAENYAYQLAAQMLGDPRIDSDNIFYTGFSFGARSVLNSIRDNKIGFRPQWRAIAAAEPGCNAFYKPVKVSFPILILKGGDSHYPVKPCRIYQRLLTRVGNRVSLKVFPDANHFFSKNGQVVDGRAFNGCSDNPVVILKQKKEKYELRFVDGNPTDIRTVIRKCFTNQGGKGKSRDRLNQAVDDVIIFFSEMKK